MIESDRQKRIEYLLNQIRWSDEPTSVADMTDDWQGRYGAAVELRHIADASIVPSLVDIYVELADVQDDPEDVVEAIEGLIHHFGEDAILPMLHEFRSEEPIKQQVVLHLLQLIGTPGDVQILGMVREALHSDNERVRETAISALAMFGTSDDVPHLLKALSNSSNYFLIDHIVGGLWRIADPKSIEPLRDLLYDIKYMMSRRSFNILTTLMAVDSPKAVAVVDEWFASTLGRQEIEQIATLRLPDDAPVPEYFRFFNSDAHQLLPGMYRYEEEVSYQMIELALQRSFLQEQAIRELKERGTPRANQVLKEWSNQQNLSD